MATKDKLVNLEDLKAVYDVVDPKITALENAKDNVVLVQSAQPASEDNKIWIPTTQGQEVEVPTYDEFTDLKSALNGYLKKSITVITTTNPANYEAMYTVEAGHVYSIKNETGYSIAATTKSQDNVTVESISGDIRNGSTFLFTASQNAYKINVYAKSDVNGTVTIEDLSQKIPELEEKTDNLETGLDSTNDTLSNLIYAKTTNATEGNVRVYDSVSNGQILKITNNSSLGVAIASKNSGGETISVIVPTLSAGQTTTVTMAHDAAYLNAYWGSAVSGSIVIENLSAKVPELEARIETNEQTIDSVKSTINNGVDVEWTSGLYYPNGNAGGSSKAIKTGFLDEVSYIATDAEHYLGIYAWDTTDNTCKGIYRKGSTFEYGVFGDSTPRDIYEFDFDAFKRAFPTHRYKAVLYRQDGTDIDTTEKQAVLCVSYVQRNWVKRRKPMLTFIDDDGRAESGVRWEEIVDELNIPVTLALVTNNMDTTDAWLTWDEVERLNNKGFEFISHTHTHMNLGDSSIPESDVIADFNATISALKTHGCNSGFIVYPYAYITASNQALVKERFKLGIHLVTDYNHKYVDRTLVRRILITKGEVTEQTIDGQTLYVYSYRTLDEMKHIIDQTIALNAWTIICTHLRNSATDSPTSDGFYYNDSIKNLILDTIRYAQNNGVQVVNVADGYNCCRDIFV